MDEEESVDAPSSRREIHLTRCKDMVLVAGTKKDPEKQIGLCINFGIGKYRNRLVGLRPCILDGAKCRGVFATSPIPARTVLDVSPVLVLDPDEVEQHVRHTKFWFYTFNWPLPASPTTASQPHDADDTRPLRNPHAAKPQTQALPLGLGAMFNHSSRRQNVGWTRDVEAEAITYVTLRDVSEGEELCISYGEGGRLGFVDADEVVRNEEMGNGEKRGHGEVFGEFMLGLDGEN